MKPVIVIATVLTAAFLAGCKEDVAEVALPMPVALTDEAAGHYCQMVILEHEGPKAQVHLAGWDAPLWFSQVRDGLAYLKSPEQSDEIRVLYVNDMAKAVDWTEPGAENWIDASAAFFVVGSNALGGMGAPEIAPFGTRESAETFAKARGGTVQTLTEISADAVLGPIELATHQEPPQ